MRRKKEKVSKDWIRFKLSSDLWDNFLRTCVASGERLDEVISKIVSEWCTTVKNQQQTHSGIQDKDKLKKEFAVLVEDLNRRSLHHAKRG